jgi:hypothetical protein
VADIIRTALGATTKHVVIATDPDGAMVVVGPVMSRAKAREVHHRLEAQGFTITYAPAALHALPDLTAMEQRPVVVHLPEPAPMADATHDPCCSSHGVTMGCDRYRRTHFVEVGRCCKHDDRPDSAVTRPSIGDGAR